MVWRPDGSGQVARRRRCSEPGEEVAVVDGDHDLRAESSGGGEGAGGEGDFAGADEAVEVFLRARAEVQRDVHAGIVAVGRVGPRCRAARCPARRWGSARVPGCVVRGLVAVFMTVRRCSNCSAVAKISRCWSPWRGLRMKAPWSWRRSSSEGSAPSWSSASVQLRATRARKSGSFSAAVRVRACSIRAAASASQVCRTRSRARVMMVAARDATSPAATAAPSSSCTGGKGSPVNPCRGSRSPARASRRRASAALIRSRARRNSVVFRYPSSTTTADTPQQPHGNLRQCAGGSRRRGVPSRPAAVPASVPVALAPTRPGVP